MAVAIRTLVLALFVLLPYGTSMAQASAEAQLTHSLQGFAVEDWVMQNEGTAVTYVLLRKDGDWQAAAQVIAKELKPERVFKHKNSWLMRKRVKDALLQVQIGSGRRAKERASNAMWQGPTEGVVKVLISTRRATNGK
jgi:hypothetical protein